jgi:hypothetical protein
MVCALQTKINNPSRIGGPLVYVVDGTGKFEAERSSHLGMEQGEVD